MAEESITPEELVSIITNVDKKYKHASKDYILIIKEEPHLPCRIYISDCEEAVWSKPLDINFFVNLKADLQLASPLKTFAGHLISSLQACSFIERDKNAIRVSIQLQIGEGLAMGCSFKVENRVHYNNPQDFKSSLRKFMLFLWQVKNNQLNKYKQEENQQKLQLERKAKEQEEEQRKIKSGMGKKVAIGKNYVVKKGDLMNPERKKRKKLGAKLGTGYESDMAVTLTQRPSDYH